jgi:hypothetical protein
MELDASPSSYAPDTEPSKFNPFPINVGRQE